MDPLVIVFGVGVGVLVGLTGIGGGSLMTPLLLIFIGTQPHVAVGTDIAYGALTKTVGGWQHLRNGTVDLGVSTWLAFGSGLVLGFVLGVTSVGSGALIGLALILFFRLTPHSVVGTDVFHAAVLLWAAGIAHVVAGNVDYGLMGNILVGSVPGVVLGEWLSRSVPAGGLRPALGAAMLASALGVASKAGLDPPAAAIIGPPLAALALAYWPRRSRSLRAASAAPATRA